MIPMGRWGEKKKEKEKGPLEVECADLIRGPC